MKSYCSLRIDIGDRESAFDGGFRRLADDRRLRQHGVGIRVSEMANYVENSRGTTTSCGAKDIGRVNVVVFVVVVVWSHKLNVIFIIRDSVFVDWIESLKAYNSFKTILQSKLLQCLGSVDFVCVCEYLNSKKKEKRISLEKYLSDKIEGFFFCLFCFALFVIVVKVLTILR